MTRFHADSAHFLRSAGFAIAALLLAGCSVFPEAEPVVRLDPRIDVESGAHGPPLDLRVGLPRPEADPARDADRVLVRTETGRLQVISNLRWVAPAPDLVQTTLIRYLRDAGAFAEVTPGARSVDRALFIDLRRFELAETSGGLRVEIELDARVLDAVSGLPLDRFKLLHEEPLASPGGADVVAGFETALADLAERIGARLHTLPAEP